MATLDVISVGSALRDIMYYTNDCMVIQNPSGDPTKKKLLCVEYGAKVRSDKVHFEFGGGASNTAINFTGLGLRTGVIASIGFDLDGRAIKEHFEKVGINTTGVQITQRQRTGFSFLVVNEKTGEHTAYVYYGASEDLSIRPSLLHRVPTSWYYISSLTSPQWKQNVTHCLSTGSSIAWNPGATQLQSGYRGLKSFFSRVTILILNKDEATELTLSHPKIDRAGTIPRMIKTIHSWGPRIVVITDSRKGSYAYDGTNLYTSPTPQDVPKDTTGAGDCYGSSFLAGYIRYSGNMKKSMELATYNATSLVHKIGAQQGLVPWNKLPKRLQK